MVKPSSSVLSQTQRMSSAPAAPWLAGSRASAVLPKLAISLSRDTASIPASSARLARSKEAANGLLGPSGSIQNYGARVAGPGVNAGPPQKNNTAAGPLDRPIA